MYEFQVAQITDTDECLGWGAEKVNTLFWEASGFAVLSEPPFILSQYFKDTHCNVTLNFLSAYFTEAGRVLECRKAKPWEAAETMRPSQQASAA